MTFVQITFGSTINRQLRNIVSWVTSDLMVHQYVQHFRTTFWHSEDHTEYNEMPYGSDINISNSHPAPVEGKCNRTDKDKLATRREIEAALFPQSTTSPYGCLPEVIFHNISKLIIVSIFLILYVSYYISHILYISYRSWLTWSDSRLQGMEL